MATTKTFKKSGAWKDIYAGAEIITAHARATGSTTQFALDCTVAPDGSASAFLTMSLNDLPLGVQIQSCKVTSSFTVSNYSGATNKGVTTPDISGSAPINQRVLEYLQENPTIREIRFGVYNVFQSGASITLTVNQSPSPMNMSAAERDYVGRDVYSYLNSAVINLEVIYEEAQTGTISFGVNNTWQRCNVYYGTGGEWKQCKAHFGSDGSWKETQ